LKCSVDWCNFHKIRACTNNGNNFFQRDNFLINKIYKIADLIRIIYFDQKDNLNLQTIKICVFKKDKSYLI
jgi:hypothetical protein